MTSLIGHVLHVACLGSVIGLPFSGATSLASPEHKPAFGPPRSHMRMAPEAQHADPAASKPLVVMAIGGSVARGWDAGPNQGYLTLALNTVSEDLNTNIKFWNESIGGYTPERLNAYFARLMKAYRPKIVIISWGILDDLAAKTPKTVFQASIRQEVDLSVQLGAKVWVVTPPVTEATYSPRDSVLEEVYAGYEIQAAKSVHPGDVQVFDVLNSMKEYLKANHQSVTLYASNAWHPNAAGHILAGQLLADMIMNRKSSLGL